MRSSLQESWSRLSMQSIVLSPLSALYALGWLSYQAVYALGFKKAATPKVRTIVVGNLLVGGAGKTPMTREIAWLLSQMGFSVVIGCSGYGSPRQHKASLAPPGELDPVEWGDEPAMHRWMSPQIPLIVGRDRVLAAAIAAENFPDHILVMDDGYQHLRLLAQVQLLLDPETPPNRLCLPAGPYREPRRIGRQRASAVLPRDFAFRMDQLPITGPDGQELAWEGEVGVLCALARPHIFLRAVERRGLLPKVVRFFPDHDPLSAGNLLKDFPADLRIVTTAKDWVKLKRRSDAADREIGIAGVKVTLEQEEGFCRWLRTQLDEL